MSSSNTQNELIKERRLALARLRIGLDEQQQDAVFLDAGALCLLAGAGSGKTRVLTHRVARRLIDQSARADHSLVLTFTRKAAVELKDRLHNLGIEEGITTGTFHAVALAQLRRRWLDAGKHVPVVNSSPMRVLQAVLPPRSKFLNANARTIANEIAWAKSHCLSPHAYAPVVARLNRKFPVPTDQFVATYAKYEQEKSRRGCVDFDDLLLLMIDAIRRDAEFARAQRWLFRHFFVDEFQDLNKAQYELLRAWMGPSVDLFVVGDANQAIYGWNGADANYLADFPKHFPDSTVLQLQTNYRSAASVLNAASAVLPSAISSQAQGNPNIDVDARPTVIHTYSNEIDEARGIAHELRLARGRRLAWRDMAVLVRTNSQRNVIESALNDVDIPFRSAGAASWMYRREVASIVNQMRDQPRSALSSFVVDIEEAAEELGTHNAVTELLSLTRDAIRDDFKISAGEFLSWVEVSSQHDGPSGSDSAVVVTTFHRSKGLEWRYVFLAGIEDGLVPFGNTLGSLKGEEQRLFYVAVTRAREELHCSWAQTRDFGKGAQQRTPSPWLYDIEEKRAEVVTANRQARDVTRQALADARAALNIDDENSISGLHRGTGIDARTRIEKWRANRARLTGVEPELVLADDVVADLAEACPTELSQLSALSSFGPIKAATFGQEIIDLLKKPSRPHGSTTTVEA